MDMKGTLIIRLNTIRTVRDIKISQIDVEIRKKEDLGEDVSDLKLKRQYLRDITEPYKELLLQEYVEVNEEHPLLKSVWSVHKDVPWDN